MARPHQQYSPCSNGPRRLIDIHFIASVHADRGFLGMYGSLRTSTASSAVFRELVNLRPCSNC